MIYAMPVLDGILLCPGHLDMTLEEHQARIGGSGVGRDRLALAGMYFPMALIATESVF